LETIVKAGRLFWAGILENPERSPEELFYPGFSAQDVR